MPRSSRPMPRLTRSRTPTRKCCPTSAATSRKWTTTMRGSFARRSTAPTPTRAGISGVPGLPDSQNDVGGWEDYGTVTRPADWDTDHDGLPNWWEQIKGLNPNSPPGDFSDSNGDPGRRRIHEPRRLSELAGRAAFRLYAMARHSTLTSRNSRAASPTTARFTPSARRPTARSRWSAAVAPRASPRASPPTPSAASPSASPTRRATA